MSAEGAVSLKGADKHRRRMKRLSDASVVRLVGAALYEGADTIKAEAQRLISAGAVSGKNHVPSRPGEPPNYDTGVLSSHIEASRTGPLTAEVRSSAPYAAALEFGTSKMAARPYMRPARDNKLPEVRKRFADNLEKIVKASGG
jgi:HK97 gp10 family phage protein